MKSLRWLAVVGLGVSLGCQDLEVTNPNNPDRDRALARPGDVEALIGTQFAGLWGVIMGSTKADATTNSSCAMETCPAATFSVIADHLSSSWGNAAMRFLAIEPRTPFVNDAGYPYRAVNQFPWYELYSVISNVNDGLRAIDGGLAIPGGPSNDTSGAPRARAFAYIMQGVAHGYLALYFDSAFVHNDAVDPATHAFQLQPYAEVMDTALAMIQKGIDIAEGPGTFTTPTTWIRGVSLSDAELAQFGHTMKARLMAYMPRTAAEAATVNWGTVLAEANAGRTTDLAPQGVPDGVFQHYFRYYSWDEGWMRGDMRTIGPADTSGFYATWVATPVASRNADTIATPDRRITDRTIDPTGATGRYWYLHDYSPFLDARGTYHHSYYSLIRFGAQSFGDQSDALLWISEEEINLLKAYAYIQSNQAALAAPLINVSRAANGGLPDVTAAGVLPTTGCVPRNPAGTACGSLTDALVHEYRMETAGTEGAVMWMLLRGLDRLVAGSLTMFPIPARELNTLGKPVYTYGGNPGSVGSAPAPGAP